MKMNNLLPKRFEISNKGTYGTVLNISGSDMYSGAAYLSSIASLRVGVGKVILCGSENTLSAVSNITPDVVLMRRENISFDNITSIVLGCGLSQGIDAVNIFEQTINSANNIPIVIDADGLNILAKNNFILPKNVILTPHPKEMARLMDVGVDEVLNNPRCIIEKCVKKYNATVVLKLHRTLVMDVNNNFYENNTGNSALAKAGSGDVLAGIIGGFLAQGMNCFDASKLGVYIHGFTGELASKDLSEYSVLASDLLKYIGFALKNLT